MADKVRIGFVGVGGMGQMAHLKNYAVVPECQVVALAEAKPTQGKLVAERYGIPKVYTNHIEMMEKEQLDGIVCSQPFSRHGILIKDLAKYGKPIFTEKPLSNSVQTGEKILKYLADGKCKHMVGYHKRSDPGINLAKAKIEEFKKSGEMGAMKYVRLVMAGGDWVANGFTGMIGVDEKPVGGDFEWDPKAPDMDDETFRQYDGFVNFYIHQVNLMRYLLGEPYEVTFVDKQSRVMMCQSKSGITCSLEMNTYGSERRWEESFMVGFDRGYISAEIPAPLATHRCSDITIYKGCGPTPAYEKLVSPWMHAMHNQAINFVNFVKGAGAAPCEATEAMEDLRIARDFIRKWKGV